jgi:hypothetical protein
MILTENDFLRETFFKKDAVALFGPFKSPDLPRYLYFFETRTQYKVTGKRSKKSDTSNGVYDTVKTRLF